VHSSPGRGSVSILGAGEECEDVSVTEFPYALRTATTDDFDELQALFGAAMMVELQPDDLARELFEPDRALVVSDGDQVVGTTRALTRDLSVPGGVVPVAHVTAVGVRATHRRRGILAEMMARQLHDVPEPVAALWASEPAIYGRFGYAPAAWAVAYEADLRRVGPRPAKDTGTVRAIPAEGSAPLLAPLLADLQRHRPGVSGRSAQRWEKRLQDKPQDRHGKNARQVLVHLDEAGAIDGYALWRGTFDWGPTGPNHEVGLEELVALRPEAYQALWSHLLTMDLAGRLSYEHAAIDEPVQQLVANPLALKRRLYESLWIRLTDVRRALRQRRYSIAMDVVLEVTDELMPANAGRYRLTGDHDEARCERTDDPADLALSVTELGAVYLGGRALTEFAATGRVHELRPGALASAAAGFRWPIPPASIEIF
jgi:predicted acetyltransferase